METPLKTARVARLHEGRGRRFRLPAEDGELFAAVVCVGEPHYIPEGVTVRVQLSEVIFTADVSRAAMEALEKDPRVFSVEGVMVLQTASPKL